MPIAVCNYFVAPLMSEPHHKSEMETQILFGEAVEILDQKGLWVLVRALFDDYEGWALKQQFVITESYTESNSINTQFGSKVSWQNIQQVVPWGANIPAQEFSFGTTNYVFNGQISTCNKQDFNAQKIIELATEFMHVPYMWGGRTHAGIDCSGFSAIVYKAFGIALKHEASWQMQHGQVVDFLQNCATGDLAFFDNAEGHITHVGILLDNNTIIHATETAGGVTVDDIDTQGIISRVSKKHTHNLRIIKRYL